MKVTKCKWKYGAQAPFMLMIDDFCNKFMTDRNNGNYLGADWGGRCNAENSFLSFIKNELLDNYQLLKITMFLVVGRRSPIINYGLKSYSKRIDEDNEFIAILKELEENPRFELAYHGLTHGKVVENEFIQEWLLYDSLEDAEKNIELGKSIYQKVAGHSFTGGKYCGYAANSISDTTIVNGGFTWWCRHGDMLLLKGIDDKTLNLDIDDFNGVVDIPSTVDGSLCSIKSYYRQSPRQVIKALYYFMRYGLTIENILDFLVKSGFPISVQEHTSPMREDKKIQRPNIIEDIDNIKYILEYIKKYKIWYATGNEIAEYYNIYKYTKIDTNQYNIDVIVSDMSLIGKTLWICVDINEKVYLISTYDNSKCEKKDDGAGNSYFGLKLYDLKNTYKIIEC